ncbi:MAG: ATP-binding cassette domain-containing protein [Gorillibacterium sp.]|nr:ATP-binding cassette domain-containing protein [Gorillibacterium sp.]
MITAGNRELVVLENVSCSHTPGAEPFLRNIDLKIPAGQWISIVGPNGSGKSSLVKLLNGLLPSCSGKIMIDGMLLTDASLGHIRERIGMVFANPDNQFIGLTVADDIVFGLENQCLDRDTMLARVAHYANKLHITPLLERHPAELSGGQKQKVAITSVLAMEPQIVVFDESTSMLDEKSKQEVVDIIQQMRASGRYTVISVTHDMDEMLASDRIIALHDGSLVADGAPEELLQREDLLKLLRLRPPFALALGRELLERGLAIRPSMDESQLLEDLWALYSSK